MISDVQALSHQINRVGLDIESIPLFLESDQNIDPSQDYVALAFVIHEEVEAVISLKTSTIIREGDILPDSMVQSKGFKLIYEQLIENDLIHPALLAVVRDTDTPFTDSIQATKSSDKTYAVSKLVFILCRSNHQPNFQSKVRLLAKNELAKLIGQTARTSITAVRARVCNEPCTLLSLMKGSNLEIEEVLKNKELSAQEEDIDLLPGELVLVQKTFLHGESVMEKNRISFTEEDAKVTIKQTRQVLTTSYIDLRYHQENYYALEDSQ